MKVKPLTRRTMTLDQLQRRVLRFIKQVKKHYSTPGWKSEMTDSEFNDKVVNELDYDIRTDRKMLGYDRK